MSRKSASEQKKDITQCDTAGEPMGAPDADEKEGAVPGEKTEGDLTGSAGDESPGGEHTEGAEESDPGSEEEAEPVLMVLTAVYPILYLSHQYRIGEALPANDPDMVEAWIHAGTAVWKPSVSAPASRARLRTAEPGLPGQAASSGTEDGDPLAGKIPKGIGRKR